MGSELVKERTPRSDEKVSVPEFFYRVLPYYVSIGMTPQEFWEGEPRLAKVYREADKQRLERKNYELWLQGLYNYKAVGCVVFNALRKKESKPVDYFDKPIRIFPLTEAEKEAEAQKQREQAVAFFNNWLPPEQREEIDTKWCAE